MAGGDWRGQLFDDDCFSRPRLQTLYSCCWASHCLQPEMNRLRGSHVFSISKRKEGGVISQPCEITGRAGLSRVIPSPWLYKRKSWSWWIKASRTTIVFFQSNPGLAVYVCWCCCHRFTFKYQTVLMGFCRENPRMVMYYNDAEDLLEIKSILKWDDIWGSSQICSLSPHEHTVLY